MRPTILLLAALCAGPASADDKALKRKADTLLKPILTGHKALGKWCKTKKFLRTSYRHYMEAIAIKSDDYTSRNAIGYVKKDGKWVIRRLKLGKIDSPSKRREAALRAELARREAALRTKEIAAYRSLAAEAKTLGMTADYQRLMSRILTWAPDDGEARAALGWERSSSGLGWVEKGAGARISGAPAGEAVAEAHPVAKPLGITLARRKSKHFAIATFEGDAQAGKLIQAAEAAHIRLHQWFAPQPELMAKRGMHLVFFPSDQAYTACIDRFSSADEKRKAHSKKCASSYVHGHGFIANRLRRRDLGFQYDRVMYLVTRNMTWNLAGGKKGNRPWLTEGVAWEMTLRMLGTRLHHSVALTEGTSTGGGKKTWSNHALWRSYLREMVLLNETPRLALVTNVRHVNEIADARAAVSWSLVRYLLQRDPKKFAAYFDQLALEKSSGEAFQQAYGVPLEQIEADWQAYVLSHY